ncbi:monofunctional biosynthetic peptidoglycan transglycosylase [Acuticoccus sediminis]|uniref:Biosynthetic peptidoglycan transglycosylase n=1 Tax=Acuticoccus sediminis TaxID=2184697 RepID=A0A8B2NS09_9HYPH|nr:biosynthetic peptidoglycan transglycosylase [Acuticoccus sediminis]RAH98162.1 monofunctional biosynthetic peptidoglycan transglycosylase [Acuticoccus sediminis]
MGAILKALGAAVATVVMIPLVLTVVYAYMDPPSLAIMRRQDAGDTVHQEWIPLDEMSPDLVRGVIMAEDARFCLHWGLDLRQMRLVVEEAMSGEAPRGASTITMQVVKNLFLWPERSYLRKAVEVPLALWMDLVLSKKRILEIYLNTAQFSGSAYGVEAAAQQAFDRSAGDLTREQALALATVLPAPSARKAARPSRRQRAVIAHVERELDRAPWVFTCLSAPFRS